LLAAGTPGPLGRFGFVFLLFLLAAPLEVVELVVVCVPDELRSLRPGCFGCGGFVLLEVVVLEVELELEVDVDELEEEEAELLELVVELDVGVALLLALVVVDDVVAGAHDSLSDTTTPWIGRFMAEIGVPGATFTLNV
jgi:hypothetical protein